MRGRLTAIVLGCALVLGFAASGGFGARAVDPMPGRVPAWSPDGSRIAFADLVGSVWTVFVVNADGSGRRAVAEPGRDAPRGISWSPDGARIAYDAFAQTGAMDPGATYVFIVGAAGGAPTRVTQGWAPSWGSNNKLAFAAHGDNGDDRIYTINPNGSSRTELMVCAEADEGGCADGDPDWSPDAKKLAFDTTLGSLSAVWTMSPDGSNRRVLTPFSPPASHPRWSPDGATIVYQHGDGVNADISVMNADGSGSRVVAKSAEFPDWSPDGKTIVFARAATQGERLYVVNADGTNERPLGAPAPPGGTTAPGTTTRPATTTTPQPAARCVVPKVARKTLAQARAALQKAHCKAGKVTSVRSSAVPKGRVVSTSPGAGARRAAGTAVAIRLSRGAT